MLLFLDVIQTIGVSLAVGSSTFAIIFYYKAIRDGVINDSEYSFMHTVYTVLRIGMAIIILTQLLFVVWYYSFGELSTFLNGAFWFQWTLIALIILNAALMQARLIPMWLGPALAGGSWYTFLVVNTLALVPLPYWVWTLYFVFFLGLFVFLLRVVQVVYVDRYQQFKTLDEMNQKTAENTQTHRDYAPLHEKITK